MIFFVIYMVFRCNSAESCIWHFTKPGKCPMDSFSLSFFALPYIIANWWKSVSIFMRIFSRYPAVLHPEKPRKLGHKWNDAFAIFPYILARCKNQFAAWQMAFKESRNVSSSMWWIIMSRVINWQTRALTEPAKHWKLAKIRPNEFSDVASLGTAPLCQYTRTKERTTFGCWKNWDGSDSAEKCVRTGRIGSAMFREEMQWLFLHNFRACPR